MLLVDLDAGVDQDEETTTTENVYNGHGAIDLIIAGTEGRRPSKVELEPISPSLLKQYLSVENDKNDIEVVGSGGSLSYSHVSSSSSSARVHPVPNITIVTDFEEEEEEEEEEKGAPDAGSSSVVSSSFCRTSPIMQRSVERVDERESKFNFKDDTSSLVVKTNTLVAAVNDDQPHKQDNTVVDTDTVADGSGGGGTMVSFGPVIPLTPNSNTLSANKNEFKGKKGKGRKVSSKKSQGNNSSDSEPSSIEVNRQANFLIYPHYSHI
jgi:hypothetical protein